MTDTQTHTAPPPYSKITHRGAASACTEGMCVSHRTATAHLREGTPLSPLEQAAADVIQDAKWILWHAHDRDLGVALILSRAGLLRDAAHEEHLARAAMSDKEWRDRKQVADRRAITAFTELAALAAGRLEDGIDPAEVAAQLRDLAAQITERRDRHAAVTTPAATDGAEQEAIPA